MKLLPSLSLPRCLLVRAVLGSKAFWLSAGAGSLFILPATTWAAGAEPGAQSGLQLELAGSAPAAGPEDSGAANAQPGNAALDAAPTLGPATTGFEYGLRLGLELPFGDVDGGASVLGGTIETRSGALSGVALFRVPVGLDLGYRVSERWWLGFDVGTGLGPVGDDCPSGAECEWSSARLGAQVNYALSPSSALQPWLGGTLGYEWLSGSVSQSVALGEDENGVEQVAQIKARERLGGPLLSVQAGLQFTLGEQLRLGPYASAAGGLFLTDTYDCPAALACPETGAADDPGVHGWVGIGVRGTHGP